MKKAYYIVSLKNTPAHIKYMYSAVLDQNEQMQEIGLDCVTEIDGEHVPFKKIFNVKSANFDTVDIIIKEHIQLFGQVLQLKPKTLKII